MSSLEQVEGTSLDLQERLCREYAQREGIAIHAVFVERGESAKTVDRTEFIKAIAFCATKRNAIDYFIVYKIDRFSRNQTDYAITKQRLKKYGTEIRSVSEKIDDSPSGKLMEIMLSGFAEFDNNIRTERSVNGMRERLKKGVWVWRAPLGYRRITRGDNLSPDPDYIPYIKTIFEEYAKGIHTYKSLAHVINERGFSTRNGTLATPQLMQIVLRNPLYCGIIRVWDIETNGDFEPIIDAQLFSKCQVSGKHYGAHPRLAKNPDFPLRRLIVCAHCHQPFTGSYCRSRNGKRHPYYHHSHQDCEYAKFHPKETLENTFADYLRQLSPSQEFEAMFRDVILDVWKEDGTKIKGTNDQVTKEINELERRKARVYELFESGTYTKEEFIAQRDSVTKKITQKQAQMSDTLMTERELKDAIDFYFDFIRNTGQKWADLADLPEERLRLQKLIFEEHVPFSENGFGTTKLSPIFELFQSFPDDKSNLVPNVIRDWNQIYESLKSFSELLSEKRHDLYLVS